VSDFIEAIESALVPLAEKYTPEDSQLKAVVHQWVHALAKDTSFYGIKFL
jgi:hypothetical protein